VRGKEEEKEEIALLSGARGEFGGEPGGLGKPEAKTLRG